MAPAAYLVELKTPDGRDLYGSHYCCRGCLPLIAPALVPAADFASEAPVAPQFRNPPF